MSKPHDLRFQVRDLLHRTSAEPGVLPVEGRDDLVRIPEEEVEEMVNVLAMETRERVEGADLGTTWLTPSRWASFWSPSGKGRRRRRWSWLESVARFGFMARVAEWERLTTARKPEGWMIAGLQGAVESSVAEEVREADEGRSPSTTRSVRSRPSSCAGSRSTSPTTPTRDSCSCGPSPALGERSERWSARRPSRWCSSATARPCGAQPARSRARPLEDFQRIWKYGFLLRSFEEFFREDY